MNRLHCMKTFNMRNICAITDNMHRVRQSEQLLKYLPVLNRQKELFALISSESNNDIKTPFHHRNINVVDDIKVINKEIDVVYLDSDESLLHTIQTLHKIMKRDILADKSIVFIQFSTQNKYHVKINEQITTESFWHYYKHFMQDSPYCYTNLYSGTYSRNSNVDSTHAYVALSLEKN